MNHTEQDSVDVETLFNVFAVARAHSERTVRSWLPPPSEADAARVVSHEEELDDPALASLDARVAEDWMDTVGIGYRPAGESLEELAGPKRSLLSNDRLRSLLLGTEATRAKGQAKIHQRNSQITTKLEGVEGRLPERNASTTPAFRTSSNNHIQTTKRIAKDDDSDEELGRSAIGKKKTKPRG